MIRIPVALLTLVLVLALAPSGSFAQHAQSFVQRQSYAGQKQQAAKAKKAKTQRTTVRSSPSGNPEWDVYVRGEYVGSDPDPRIRATLAAEARRGYGLRN